MHFKISSAICLNLDQSKILSSGNRKRQKESPYHLTHYQTTNFRLFKLKDFADDNFKFDENSKKLSEWVQNTVGRGEIARYEQFLLFPPCFQKGV